MVMMATTGIPNIAILAYQNKDKTDFDKSTDEYIFGDMAFWPLTIISLTFTILIFCPNSGCDILRGYIDSMYFMFTNNAWYFCKY